MSPNAEIEPRAAVGRDPFVDFLRAFSLLVVVVWHWVFTILVWEDDGPHATSPLGFTDGLWLVTWLLQVMPLFFYVGGYANLVGWQRYGTRGGGIWQFVGHRVRQLAVPALALFATWMVIAIVAVSVFDARWMQRVSRLVVSPLWFIAAYLVVILLMPLTFRLHQRFGALVLVWGVGLSALVDVARFREGDNAIGWLNMLFVWALCHQLGYFYGELARAGRRVHWMFFWGGLFALAVLTFSDIYPGSLVGVPGERFSNLGPPTVMVIACVFFQVGVAMLLRPWVLSRLDESEGWASFNATINRLAMPLFLFHTTGLALARGFWHLVRGGEERVYPDLVWWLFRPLAFLGALVCTLPVIWLFGRRWLRPERPTAPARR